MSTALNKAIRRRLTGEDALTGEGLEAQTRLAQLLAADPLNAAVPMVVYGNFSDDSVFPSITFRQDGGIPSWISRSEELGVVGQPEYTFEVWSNTRDDTVVSDVLDLLEQLIDDRRGLEVGIPCLTLDAGWFCVAVSTIMEPALRYDEQRNAWFGLVRFQAIEQRYKQGS